MNKSAGWISQARVLLDRLENTQLTSIQRTAEWCAQAISSGGLVHLFGSGHSRIAVEEMFPRYGSFPGFHPLVELSMTFHTEIVGTNSQPAAMFIERTEGLADVILNNFTFGPDDVMVVFSASGRSAAPLEMALGARKRGLRVVGVTSVVESLSLPTSHSTGFRLLDCVDIVIDIGTPVGDALVSIDGLDTPVGPGSTLVNAAVVNELKVRTAELLVESGDMPPVITSESLVGESESKQLFARAYAEHGRRLGRALTKPDESDPV